MNFVEAFWVDFPSVETKQAEIVNCSSCDDSRSSEYLFFLLSVLGVVHFYFGETFKDLVA